MMIQISRFIQEKRQSLEQESAYSETDEMNEFLGFCAGIICDGVILENEAQAILNRFKESDVLMTSALFLQLRRAIEAALEDQILTKEESEDVREWIAQLVGDGFVDTGIPNIGTVLRLDDPITDPDELTLHGAHFVLTGPMKFGTRTFIQAEIERVGGVCDPRTTQRTDYLVVSSEASRHWRTTHFGTKIERAKELIEEGHKLRFVSEDALAKAIYAFDAPKE